MAKKPTFEQAIEKLEQIVSDMEEGRIGLEESIARYAEGAKLIRYCRGVLDTAEKKIRLLTSDENGELELDGDLPDLDGEVLDADDDTDADDDDEDDAPF